MRILHLQCLQDAPDRAIETASYAAAMGVPPETLDVVRPFETDAAPSLLDGASGLTIGGSALSVFYAIPRYAAFEDLLREARRRGLPIFGVCFGAQALADVFGGKVIRDPARSEYGTIEVHRTDAGADDPIFSAAPRRFSAQSWHRDRIVRLPEGAESLASSPSGVLQAFRFPGERIWGAQFHPERDAETFDRLLETRTSPSTAWPIERIRATLAPSPEATSSLARFARLCAAGR